MVVKKKKTTKKTTKAKPKTKVVYKTRYVYAKREEEPLGGAMKSTQAMMGMAIPTIMGIGVAGAISKSLKDI